jgi:uncharacterized protein (TIGR00251 family)
MTPAMIPIRDSPQGASFAVRVQPRAARTKITGVFGEGEHAALKVALAAPPVEGRANQALIEFFAGLLNVPRSHIEVLTGTQSRNKVLRVRGRTAAELRSVLE